MEAWESSRVVDFRMRINFMIILMIMNDSKRWRTLMKRLAYLRAEAAESVESFEESVKEIEKNIEEKQDLPSEEKSAKEEIPTISGTSMIRLFSGKSSNERSKEEEKKNLRFLWRN